MRTLLSLILLLTFITTAFSQTEKLNKVRINFSKKNYDNLDLRIALDDKSRLIFKGKIVSDSIWEFAYPDSLYDYIRHFDIDNQSSSDSTYNSISFASILSGDTLWCASFHISRGDVNLNANFYQLNVFERNLQDRYLIEGNQDQELLISTIANSYSFFNNSQGKTGPIYRQELDTYISMTRRFPDSQKLISRLSSTISYYLSREDISEIFDLFSQRAKESYFGMKINRFLNMKTFENMNLYSLESGQIEPILRHEDKYTLIVFSASWCKWCHEMIPIVEEIHRVAGNKLDIVYISIDDEVTRGKWNELVKNGKIPFRSMSPLNSLETVKKKYFVHGIPYTLFVHPDNKVEVLNLWEEINRKKLYQVLNLDMIN